MMKKTFLALLLFAFTAFPLHAEDTTERRHPNHKMEVTFVPAKESFSQDGPVLVTLEIKNIGNTPFMFWQGGRQRGPRDNQFAFSGEQSGRMLPDIGNPMNLGGIMRPVHLDPQEKVDIHVDLTKWFDFTEPGRVMLRGSYYMSFADPQSTNYSKIWEDFASAEFSIQIE
ncbi:MAG: hypothetical protein JJT75_12520 [Opitutales bacterium]|nr:hypothetical protein [Opitutales bacterium]MCH8541760.1 hypothetical protein [Opitutales bacterium]